mgnify:CR=1 FL=1
MTRLGKNTMRALRSANSVEDLIEKFAQPDTHRYCGRNNQMVSHLLRKGKTYYSEWYGMINPPKINISADTLNKIKERI